MIKITEQQAIEMLMSLEYFINCYNIIEKWKEKGYIKKSAKEEFEEYLRNLQFYFFDISSISSLKDYKDFVSKNDFNKIIDLARTVIKEEYQRGFTAGCVDKS